MAPFTFLQARRKDEEEKNVTGPANMVDDGRPAVDIPLGWGATEIEREESQRGTR